MSKDLNGNLKNDPISNINFGKIGLSLSGGGYRAAAFHLGTLAYLYRVRLLPHVCMISTVSGGTFTGMSYILALVNRKAFPDFFQTYYAFLRDTNLIELGLEALKQDRIQVPSGQRNLILAMAQVYAETFLSDSEGRPYTFGSILDADIPIQEATFNATDFRHGVAFRFQRSANPKARIGNGHVAVPRAEAAKIRLADIVAASSCFPGGFEPIAFPDDFAWPQNKVPDAVRDAVYRPPVQRPIALMDGGIYDNQGVTSLVLADERNIKDLGLVIISDVDDRLPDLFPLPASQGKPARTFLGRLTLGQLDWFIRLLLVICGLTVVSVGYGLWERLRQGTFIFWPDFFASVMPLGLALAAVVALWGGRTLIRDELLPRIPQAGRRGWQTLRRLTVTQFLYLLELRLKSLLALTGSVFMRRIRGLVLSRIYGDRAYQGKVIANFIYELTTGRLPNFGKFPGVEPPSAELQKILDRACKLPTTLWFDDAQQLKDVVVAGQAAICFNLIDYVVETHGQDASIYPPEVQALWGVLLKDWQRLNRRPDELLKDLLA